MPKAPKETRARRHRKEVAKGELDVPYVRPKISEAMVGLEMLKEGLKIAGTVAQLQEQALHDAPISDDVAQVVQSNRATLSAQVAYASGVAAVHAAIARNIGSQLRDTVEDTLGAAHGEGDDPEWDDEPLPDGQMYDVNGNPVQMPDWTGPLPGGQTMGDDGAIHAPMGSNASYASGVAVMQASLANQGSTRGSLMRGAMQDALGAAHGEGDDSDWSADDEPLPGYQFYPNAPVLDPAAPAPTAPAAPAPTAKARGKRKAVEDDQVKKPRGPDPIPTQDELTKQIEADVDRMLEEVDIPTILFFEDRGVIDEIKYRLMKRARTELDTFGHTRHLKPEHALQIVQDVMHVRALAKTGKKREGDGDDTEHVKVYQKNAGPPEKKEDVEMAGRGRKRAQGDEPATKRVKEEATKRVKEERGRKRKGDNEEARKAVRVAAAAGAADEPVESKVNPNIHTPPPQNDPPVPPAVARRPPPQNDPPVPPAVARRIEYEVFTEALGHASDMSALAMVYMMARSRKRKLRRARLRLPGADLGFL